MDFRVPFFSNHIQHKALRQRLGQALGSVLDSGQLVRGPGVKAFEEAFRRRIGASYAAGVGNGTDALQIALKALEIGPGDEVITPAWSWISTAAAISLAGGTPVFADVDPSSLTITQETVLPKITARTRAVIAVHLYGQCAPLRDLSDLCRKHDLALIEDCAQGILSSEKGTVAGSVGTLGAFSFYPTKNLGALGDAGLVTTNDPFLAERVRRLANHGALQKDDHAIEGTNSRLDELQAAFLCVKLDYLEEWTDARIEIAHRYLKALSGIGELVLPSVREGTRHTFHLFVIRTQERDKLKMFLEQRGIQTLVHYPRALPFLPPYLARHREEEYPHSGSLQNEALSLPLYPEIPADQQEFVADTIRGFFNVGRT